MTEITTTWWVSRRIRISQNAVEKLAKDGHADIAMHRDRMGLCLSGGGFRAAFFHLGVLYRLAELDVLRRVEVISCVSGGAIVGAAYQILLRRKIEDAVEAEEETHEYIRLGREDYLAIVHELRNRLAWLTARHLVARLFLSPITLLRIVLPGYTLSDALTALVDKHLFQKLAPDGRTLRLADLAIEPARLGIYDPNAPEIQEDPASYNRRVLSSFPQAAAATRLILNATSLNSGSRFWFASDEVGEWRLGYIHADDAEKLQTCCSRKGIATSVPGDITDDARRYGILLDRLRGIAMGQLRLIRRAAKALLKFDESPRQKYVDGRTKAEHELVLAGELATATHNYRDTVQAWLQQLAPSRAIRLFEYIDSVYMWRSVVNMSPTAGEDLEKWSVAKAVVASANFPPVFPPLRMREFYRNHRVEILGLTDGGVYDNLGTMGVLNEYCNYVIVSDAGRKSPVRKQIKPGRLQYLFRITSILGDKGDRAAGVRLLELHGATAAINRVSGEENPGVHREMAGRDLHGLGMFRMDSPMVKAHVKASGLEEAGRDFTGMLTRIRTNLDVFNVVEQQILMRHGAAVLDLYYKRWFCYSKRLPSWEVSPDKALRISDGEAIDAEAVDRWLPNHLRVRYGDGSRYPFAPATKLPAEQTFDDDDFFMPVRDEMIVNAVLRVANIQFGRVPCALLNIALKRKVARQTRFRALMALIVLVLAALLLIVLPAYGACLTVASLKAPDWALLAEAIPVSATVYEAWFKVAVTGVAGVVIAALVCRNCLNPELKRKYASLIESDAKTRADIFDLESLAKRDLFIRKFPRRVSGIAGLSLVSGLLVMMNDHYLALGELLLFLVLAGVGFAMFCILEARCLDYVIGARADASSAEK